MSSSPTSPPVQYVNSPRNVKFPPTPENLKKFQFNVNSDRSPYPNIRLFASSSPTSDPLPQPEPHFLNVKSSLNVNLDQQATGVNPVNPVNREPREPREIVNPVNPVNPVNRETELNDRERSIASEARYQAVQHYNTDLHQVIQTLLHRESTHDSAEQRKPSRSDDSLPDFVSSLSISDPAGNVLHDLSACVHLDTKLVNEKLSVATVQALFDHALHRHPQLLKILEAVSKGQTVKYAILSFRNLFQSLFKPTERTLAMVSILAVSRMSLSVEIKTKTAIKVAASTQFSELQPIGLKAAALGSIPALNSDLKTLTLTQLPGIVQLQSYSSPEEIEAHWTAMADFIIKTVCFVQFEKQELVSARQQLASFSALQAVDMHLTVAAYEGLFDVCTNWFGKPVETDYDKIQRFISRCPAIVRTEYVSLLTESKCDEYSMDWERFMPVLTEAWDTAFRKQQLTTELGLDQGQPVQHSPGKPHVKLTVQDTDSLRNIELSCEACGNDFNFAAKTQRDFALKEPPWEAPKRCTSCRGSTKECDLFARKGECPYGDKCRFTHTGQAVAPAQQSNHLPPIYPGHYDRECSKFPQCERQDACTYKHPGREREQKVLAIKMRSADTPPETGYTGLSKHR
jgi:hypothetical protein